MVLGATALPVSDLTDKDGWTQILTAAGECGYIRSSFLSCAPKSLYLDEYAEMYQTAL